MVASLRRSPPLRGAPNRVGIRVDFGIQIRLNEGKTLPASLIATVRLVWGITLLKKSPDIAAEPSDDGLRCQMVRFAVWVMIGWVDLHFAGPLATENRR